MLRSPPSSPHRVVPQGGLCDPHVRRDSPLEEVHLEHNLIDLGQIPASTFSCLRAPATVLLEPQSVEQRA